MCSSPSPAPPALRLVVHTGSIPAQRQRKRGRYRDSLGAGRLGLPFQQPSDGTVRTSRRPFKAELEGSSRGWGILLVPEIFTNRSWPRSPTPESTLRSSPCWRIFVSCASTLTSHMPGPKRLGVERRGRRERLFVPFRAVHGVAGGYHLRRAVQRQVRDARPRGVAVAVGQFVVGEHLEPVRRALVEPIAPVRVGRYWKPPSEPPIRSPC